MFYERRPIKITPREQWGPQEQLAHDLSKDGVTYTLCTAFRLLSGAVLVNDATSEDGAGEWAVLLPYGEGTYSQVDSITFGWMTYDNALAALRRIEDPAYRDHAMGHVIQAGARLIDHPEGTCPCCA